MGDHRDRRGDLGRPRPRRPPDQLLSELIMGDRSGPSGQIWFRSGHSTAVLAQRPPSAPFSFTDLYAIIFNSRYQRQ